ncbi:MAG: recombinase family protein [Candidatus Metalachnospira sp.]|nr:recombinase family protein [Candidatus Metalachnospira sp.]
MKRITKIEEDKIAVGKNKLRVAAYCRVSTASDEQIISLEAQKAYYENYIKTNPEWYFAGLYYDEGISGTKKEKRAGLLSMIKDCENGKIDFIITKSISRFARNTTDCLELVRKLLDLGISIHFEKEDINTKSMESELMLSILGGLAENESVSISDNEKWSIQKRFKKGTFVISYPPYGYENVSGEMVIVPEQAEIVRGIFADVLAGKGTYTIASDLNKRKIATKRDGKWSPSTIRGMICNEKYMGDAIFQKTYTDSSFNRHVNDGEYDQYLSKENHEPIINYEDFEKANAVLKQHGKEKGIEKYSRKSQNRYTFSGRIKCSECGSNFKRRMRYKSSGEYVVWCCSKHLQNVNDCSMKYITDEAVKIAFVTMMNKLIFAQKTVLKPLLQRLKGMNDKEMLLRIEEIEILIEKNMEQRQVLTSLMAKRCLEPALFNKESNALTVGAARLREERESLIHSINGDRTKIDELQKLVKFTAKGNVLSQFNDEIFLAYVEKITVLSSMDIEFELKCGLKLKERLVD